MKTFLGKKIKDLTQGELYCYKLDKRHKRAEKFYRVKQQLFQFLLDLLVLRGLLLPALFVILFAIFALIMFISGNVETLRTVARILGGLILVLWVFSILGVRRMCRVQGHWMWATVFQYTILPFMVGILLLTSGNFLALLLGAVAWILSMFFPTFFMFISPLPFGWALGQILISYWEPLPTFWHYAAGPVGLVVMFIICTIVTAIVTTPPRNRTYNQETAASGIILPRKTTLAAADCSLRDFPLLCLYFDNFEEIQQAWQQGSFDAARHDDDIRSCYFSLDEIMGDEDLFLDLYRNRLLRLRLLDATELRRDSEENYWDRIVNPDKYAGELSFRPDCDPELAAMMREDRKRVDAEVNAIRLRYGLTNSDSGRDTSA